MTTKPTEAKVQIKRIRIMLAERLLRSAMDDVLRASKELDVLGVKV